MKIEQMQVNIPYIESGSYDDKVVHIWPIY